MIQSLSPYARAKPNPTGYGRALFCVGLALLVLSLPVLTVRGPSGAAQAESKSGVSAPLPPTLEPGARPGFLSGARKLDGWTLPHKVALSAAFASPQGTPKRAPFPARRTTLVQLQQLRLAGG